MKYVCLPTVTRVVKHCTKIVSSFVCRCMIASIYAEYFASTVNVWLRFIEYFNFRTSCPRESTTTCATKKFLMYYILYYQPLPLWRNHVGKFFVVISRSHSGNGIESHEVIRKIIRYYTAVKISNHLSSKWRLENLKEICDIQNAPNIMRRAALRCNLPSLITLPRIPEPFH